MTPKRDPTYIDKIMQIGDILGPLRNGVDIDILLYQRV